MMTFKIEQTNGRAVLRLAGNLTIEHAKEMRMAVIKALIDADSLLMDIGNMTDVDLSCLELFCSAHRAAVRLNKRVAFTGSRPEKFIQLTEAAGYSRTTGCSRDRDDSCLWMARQG